MSVQPQEPTQRPHSRPIKRTRRITAPQITARKNGEPIVCLTAYDAPTAEIMDPHCDLILVGDSVGNGGGYSGKERPTDSKGQSNMDSEGDVGR